MPDLLRDSPERDLLRSHALVSAAEKRVMDQFSTVAVALLAGSLRVSTPFLFVSIGECLTEKAGRINLGNEGALVLGAMLAYVTSYETGCPWLGLLAVMLDGAARGASHVAVC